MRGHPKNLVLLRELSKEVKLRLSGFLPRLSSLKMSPTGRWLAVYFTWCRQTLRKRYCAQHGPPPQLASSACLDAPIGLVASLAAGIVTVNGHTVQVQVGRGSVLLVADTTNRKYQVQVDPKPRAALFMCVDPDGSYYPHVLAMCSACC